MVDINIKLIEDAGLTEGEAKVYMALLKLGSSTTGPIVEKSGVANSFVYRILNSLIEKGMVSYIIKEKTKYFQAERPEKLIDYIEERKSKLDSSKKEIEFMLPEILALTKATGESSVKLFEGFRGFQTAWELMYSKSKRGDEYHSLGIYPIQEEKFHTYWQKDHLRRIRAGVKCKLLFNQGTDREILKNRNSYRGCDARYMPASIKTFSEITVYKDVTYIFLQSLKGRTSVPMAIVIVNQEIADTFEQYFQHFWKKSKPEK